MWMTTILTHWRSYLVVGLIACQALTLGLLQRAWNQVAEKTAEIDSMRLAATAYKENSEKKAKEISDEFTRMVASLQDQNTAIKNAQSRFGSCRPTNGVRFVRVPTEHGASETSVPKEPSGPQESERLAVSTEFVNGCAADAAFVGAVQEWRIANDLPVE